MLEQDFLQKYCDKLNTQQLAAVKSVDGPVLLLAVPGSGKTTTLVNRLGYMIYVRNIQPENILTLTYTVAATRDMASRYASVFGQEELDGLQFRTINGICAKIISEYGRRIGKKAFDLVTEDNQTAKLLSDIYVKYMGEYPTESDIKNVRTLITYAKNMMLGSEEIKKLGKDLKLELLPIYNDYNKALRSSSLMDYDDQMVYALKMLQSSKELLEFYQDQYRYICVDEAQDTSKIQHMIISLLAGSRGNLFMVGDEDQSIYGFRAAFPDALLNFEKDHPGAQVLVMDKNYRSNAKIVEAADYFIQHNRDRHPKHIVASRAEGEDIKLIPLSVRSGQYNYLMKVAKDVQHETAVLYRDNESVLPLVDILERESVPYRIKSIDMGFFTHRIVTDIVNIINFAFDQKDTETFLKIYFKFQTYLKKPEAEALCRISVEKDIDILEAAGYISGLNGNVLGKCRSIHTHLKNMKSEEPIKAINRIERYMGYGDYIERNSLDAGKLFILKRLAYNEKTLKSFLHRLSFLQERLKNQTPDYSCKFILSTIHSSKGLEYDEVYLMDICDGVFPAQTLIDNRMGTAQDRKAFEEERRLFYVGMTRAKNRLSIFNIDAEPSFLIKEMKKVSKENAQKASLKATPKAISVEYPKELVIGERIRQPKYGAGTIVDVTYDVDEKPHQFEVEFDSGLHKTFKFHIAFASGMEIIQ
ncbi:MAG: ATP-dependent helicase [Butyrivibrio sp.]|nr:ATP-dependent helicase [Butyrivibrio sp.]